MKNLIEPAILAQLKAKPTPYEDMAKFLAENENVSTSQLCRRIGLEPQYYYNWKARKNKAAAAESGSSDEFAVEPTGIGKKKYSPSDKLKLINHCEVLDGSARAEFLRKFGLYQSDLDRWNKVAKEAALDALSMRKQRSDKKSAEQVELEKLKTVMKGQEKTIAKLSALVEIQKKISEILGYDAREE